MECNITIKKTGESLQAWIGNHKEIDIYTIFDNLIRNTKLCEESNKQETLKDFEQIFGVLSSDEQECDEYFSKLFSLREFLEYSESKYKIRKEIEASYKEACEATNAVNIESVVKSKNESTDFFNYQNWNITQYTEYTNLVTLHQLEKLKSFYNINYSVDIIINKEISVQNYDENTTDDKYEKISEDILLKFGFCTIEQALADIGEQDHQYTYYCKSMIDIPFALLNYLTLNGYKLRRCQHCMRYFFTKSLKQKYCSRNSPYLGYENLDCAKAVDNIMSKIRQRKKTVLSTISEYYPEAMQAFSNLYDLLNDKKTTKSVGALKTFERVLSRKYVKEMWYKKEYCGINNIEINDIKDPKYCMNLLKNKPPKA